MTPLELLICASLVSFSAYLSASEVALFSLSRFQLRSLKENFRPIHRRIKRLLSDPGGLLISILVLNELVNISLSALIAKMVSRSHLAESITIDKVPTWAIEMTLSTLVTAPVVLFLCEISPKVIGTKINQLIASISSRPLLGIYRLLKPLRILLKWVIRLISSLSNPRKSSSAIKPKIPDKDDINAEGILKEADFLLMVEEGHKEGDIQESELELVKNVFELDDTPVIEIATPLSKVFSIPAQTTLEEALATVRSRHFSRIPVLSENKKEVVGILYAKDLLRSKLRLESAKAPVADLMRKPLFVGSHMKLNALFRRFKLQKTHMAIVKNASGEMVGVVTMNDVLNALLDDLFADEETSERGHPRQFAYPWKSETKS